MHDQTKRISHRCAPQGMHARGDLYIKRSIIRGKQSHIYILYVISFSIVSVYKMVLYKEALQQIKLAKDHTS